MPLMAISHFFKRSCLSSGYLLIARSITFISSSWGTDVTTESNFILYCELFLFENFYLRDFVCWSHTSKVFLYEQTKSLYAPWILNFHEILQPTCIRNQVVGIHTIDWEKVIPGFPIFSIFICSGKAILVSSIWLYYDSVRIIRGYEVSQCTPCWFSGYSRHSRL